MYEYLDKYRIPFRKIGKFIVATDSEQELELDKLRDKGKRLNIPLEYLKNESVKEMEPNLRFCKVLYSKETGIVDSHKFMSSLEEEIIEKGGQVFYRTECVKIQGNRVYIHGNTVIEAERIINCAGLDALSLVDEDSRKKHRIHYAKGHYIKYNGKSLVNRLIYPMPEKDLKSLGIHCTLDLDGRLKFGPDFKYLQAQEKDYSLPAGQEEIDLIQKFHKQVSKYLTGVDIERMSVDYAGIRPKLSGENDGFKDFVIEKDSTTGVINLLGIESPGLTSSLAIAEYVANL
jgi:L-2-hydroxyglutarate oxidase LhgO